MPKSRALQLEHDVINDLNATPHANSGAMKKKHDGSDDHFLYEVKTTESKQYGLKFEYFEEVQKQAFKRGLLPVMVIVATRPQLSLEASDKYVVLRYEDFKEIKDVWESEVVPNG